MVLTIAAAVFVFGLLVLVHELGHFVTAKLTGMRVDEFAIGFGPQLIAVKRGETVYSLRAVPLGGFNNIAGLVTSALIGRSYKRSFEPETDSNKPDPDNMMSYVDLTNLKVIATEEDISLLIERAVSQGCASVCIPTHRFSTSRM